MTKKKLLYLTVVLLCLSCRGDDITSPEVTTELPPDSLASMADSTGSITVIICVGCGND